MFPHFGGGSALPEIGHSLRFNSADSAYCSRTFGTPTNGAKWALSFWVKRGSISTLQCLLGTGTVAGNMMALDFSAANQLQIYYPNTGANLNYLTNAVFRDTAAWLHIFVYFDSANGTTADRLQIWVNGVRQTFSTATYPSAASGFNSAGANHQFGRHPVTGSQFDGYMSRITFVDNPSGVTPSSFAYTDPNGQWRTKSAGACKAVVDAGGTNSFMLDFDDGSSTTTLGNDYSSKNNDWTLTNFTRSAGVNDDWMTDTPTNNYCTLNPLVVQMAVPTFSDGTLKYSSPAAYKGTLGSIQIPSSGKWYWEGTPNATSTNSAPVYFGIGNSSWITGYDATGFQGANWQASTHSAMSNNGSGYIYVASTITTTDVIAIALDIDNAKMWLGKNNVWYDSSGGATGNPSAGTNAVFTTLLTDPLFPGFGSYSNGMAINFGQRAFTYTPPTGFKALCTQNLVAGSVTTSGSFTGNAAADGPFVWLNGTPTAMTINGNAVTFGTHADKLANGFKLRTSSASYNASGSNTYSISTNTGVFKFNNAEGNP